MAIKFMMFHMPTDPDQLLGIARISIRHGQLDHMLRLTIKTVERITVAEAMKSTRRTSSRQLRKRIKNAARDAFGAGETLDRLTVLLKRARKLSEDRNGVIHGTIAKEEDGDPQIRDDNNRWGPLLSAAELDALAAEIESLTNELDAARQGGFLMAELVRKGLVMPPKDPPNPPVLRRSS